jgi:hypothetical protein
MTAIAVAHHVPYVGAGRALRRHIGDDTKRE